MDEAGIRETIRDLAGSMAPIRRPAALPDAQFLEDLGYDSLHLMSLVTEVFDVFELDLPDVDEIEQLEDIETVGQLEDAVLRRLGSTERVR